MAVTITHTTPADGTFSATGAAAWDANHAVSGLGTMAEQNANSVSITGGSISGVTGVAASGTNSDITSLTGLTTPLSVAQGGSGTATPSLVAGAKIAVSGSWPNQTIATTGAAASGANSDITSLSGLTTPLSVGQGGSGTATPSLIAGTNITISGSWPNQTINATASGSVTSVTASSPLSSSGGATPDISFTGILGVSNGGTGTATPSLVAGTRITLSGSWPNQTINADVSGLAASGANSDITSLSGLTTPLSLLQGGTGASTQSGAANAILPSQTSNSGKYLTTDGSNVSWATVTGGSGISLAEARKVTSLRL